MRELADVASSPAAETRQTEVELADRTECCILVAQVARDLAKTAHDLPAWNALAGSALGPYRLEAQIGQGAMGAVYRAHDERLGRSVAIKMLHAAEPTRLMAEARAAAAVEHPNIVAIHDCGAVRDIAYLAMELVEGETLRSILERGPLPTARARDLALDLARGLAAAHARGVVHRDLKPANLVVTREGHLKILDFGLAKRSGVAPVDAIVAGTVQGTAGYMAPEQARGEATDARTDLFAAGAILFEMLTGRRAFDGDTYGERVAAILGRTPDLGDLGRFAPIVERCLAKDPMHRFHSAADLAWTLSMVPATPPPPSLRRRFEAALTSLAIPVLRRWLRLPPRR